MSKKLAYERFCRLHEETRAGLYPNARRLSEIFEISQKQAQRDIEFLRERLGAPLVYNAGKKGYEYKRSDYELPSVWFNEDELLALCLASQLTSDLPDMLLRDSLYRFLDKLLSSRSLDSGLSIGTVRKKVSVKNIQSYRVNEDIFHKAVVSLLNGQGVSVTYHSPFRDQTTQRVIQPLHLLHYMGNWHLIAYCTLRKGLRDFSLSRIRQMATVSFPVNVPSSLPSVTEYIGRNFGVLKGDKSVEVCLKFSPEIADWVAEQVWHVGQSMTVDKDNFVRLTFPVADFREVRREILRFGSQVEVLSPPDLRRDIREEIQKMAAVYR